MHILSSSHVAHCVMNPGREIEVSNSLPEARSRDGGRGRESVYNGHGGGVGPEVINALTAIRLYGIVFELGLPTDYAVGGRNTVPGPRLYRSAR